jgi:hypothetical protein
MATPLPPVPNTLRARFTWSEGDNPNINIVTYFQYAPASAPLSVANCISVANSIMGYWVANPHVYFAPSITLQNVVVTDLGTITGAEGQSTNAPNTGGGSGASVPAGTAMVMSLPTALRGRSYRGRMFLPGLEASQVLNPQQWQGAYVTNVAEAVETFWASLYALGAPGPIQACVVSYFSGKTANPNPLSKNRFVPTRRVTPLSTIIVDCIGKTRIASQRRRNA